MNAMGQTVEYAHQYLDREIALVKLEVAEKAAKSTSALITLAVIGFLSAMVLIMLSVSAGFWLGTILGSYALAFLLITAVYAGITVAIYFLQKRLITNPVLTILLKSFFD